MRLGRLLVLVLIGCALAGCVRKPRVIYYDPVKGPPVAAAPAAAVPMPLPAPAAVVAVSSFDAAYTLDSGDKLRVVVFGQEGLTNSYSVDSSGCITMPLIGAVPARGGTTAALAAAITARLRQGYVREPHVAVEVETYRPFFILGEVTNPGQYPYVANMTVQTAVAIAGGFTPRAKRSRVQLDRPADGAIARDMVPLNNTVRPGDTIVVGERWF